MIKIKDVPSFCIELEHGANRAYGSCYMRRPPARHLKQKRIRSCLACHHLKNAISPKNFTFAKAQTSPANRYKRPHVQIVAAILTIVVKRKVQCEACRSSYRQKGAMLQYFVCNKNATKVRKMTFFLRAKQSLKEKHLRLG